MGNSIANDHIKVSNRYLKYIGKKDLKYFKG